MGCDQPSVLAVNKVDRLGAAEAAEIARRLGIIAGLAPLLISAAKGTGMRELRHAIDELAAEAVPDTRANRPIIAAESFDAAAPQRDRGPVDAPRRAAS